MEKENLRRGCSKMSMFLNSWFGAFVIGLGWGGALVLLVVI
jgi:hypothetical protein